VPDVVDTRVVEAKFNSEQFEKGVDRTVKKLDELKKSLNLADADKSIAELSNKTKEATEKASESLEKLQKGFTSFTGMLRQKLLSGIADEVVGVFFKIQNSFNGLVHSLSSAQVSYGMQRYTDILGSVRTLVSAGETQEASYNVIERLGTYADQTSYSLDQLVSTMAKFKTSGASLDTAQRMVEGLSNAAASMGVNTQEATRAYLNLQQAYSKGAMLSNDWISFESLPMVGTKFNQAILDAAVAIGTLEEDKKKKGTYKTKKLAGSEVKTSGADTSGITAENLGTKLASRWFNKQVMEKVFGEMYYFSTVDVDKVNEIKEFERDLNKQLKENTITQEQYNAAMDEYFENLKSEEIADKTKELQELLSEGAITQEEYTKQLNEFTKGLNLTRFSWEAFRAGQEARSFTDVLNTLKDTISRGWAKSFEYLFGKLDEAATFFTQLTESNLASAIYAIGDFRNSILEKWSANGGRDSMVGALTAIDDLLGDIFKKVGLLSYSAEEMFDKLFDKKEYDRILSLGGYDAAEAYKTNIKNQAEEAANSFDNSTKQIGIRLAIMSRDIKNFILDIRDWFNQVDENGISRIDRIGMVFERIGILAKGAGRAVGMGFDGVLKLFTALSPLFDHIFDAIIKVSQPFFDLINPDVNLGNNAYSKVQDGIGNIVKLAEKASTVLSPVVDFLADIGVFFADMSASSIQYTIEFFSDLLGLVLEIIGVGSVQQEKDGKGVIGGIADDIKELGDACKQAFGAVGDFFKSIIDDLRVLLGIDKANGDVEEGGIFKNISKFFETNDFVQKVKENFNKAIENIGNFIRDLPNRISKFVSHWTDSKTSLAEKIGGFSQETYDQILKSGGWTEAEKYRKSHTNPIIIGIQKWLDQAVKDVWSFISVTIPNTVKGIPSAIGTFFRSLFYVDNGELKPDAKGVYHYGDFVDNRTPLKKWLDQAVEDVKKFITQDIPNAILSIPSLIGSFVHGLFYEKATDRKGNALYYRDVNGNLKEFERKTVLKKWLDSTIANVKKFITVTIPANIKKIPSIIGSFFDKLFYVRTTVTGKDGKKYEQVTNTNLKRWLDQAVEDVKKFITVTIPDTVKRLPSIVWNFIEGLFYERRTVTGKNGNTYDLMVATPLNEWLNQAVSDVWHFITVTIPEFVSKVPSIIGEFIDGLFYKKYEVGTKNGMKQYVKVETPLKNWFDQAVIDVENFIKDIPKKIGNTLDVAGKFFKTLFDPTRTLAEKVGGFSQETYDQILKGGGWTEAEKYRKSHTNTIVKQLEDWVRVTTDAVKKFITEDVPNFVTTLPSIIDTFFGSLFSEENKKNGQGFIEDIVNDWDNVFDQRVYDDLIKQNKIVEAGLYKQGTENANPIAKFFKGVINSVGALFSNMGPVILDGINKAIQWLGNGVTNLTNWLNAGHEKGLDIGGMIAEENKNQKEGKGNPLWESIQNIGQSIWKFITETIPKFIESAVAEVSMQIPKLFSKLFSSGNDNEAVKEVEKEANKTAAVFKKKLTPIQEKMYNDILVNQGQEAADKWRMDFVENMQDSTSGAEKGMDILSTVLSIFGLGTASAEGTKDTENAAESAEKQESFWDRILGTGKDIFNKISDFINAVSNNKLIGISVVLIAVTALLAQLKDMLSIGDEIEDIGYTIKWTGITIFISGLVGVLAYLAALNLDDTIGADGKTKLQRFLETLESFGTIIKEILDKLMWYAGIKYGLKALGAFFDWRKEAAELKKAKKEQGKSSDDVVDAVTDLFDGEKETGELINGIAKNEYDGLFKKGLTNLTGWLGSGAISWIENLGGTLGKTTGLSLGAGQLADVVELMSGNIADALSNLGLGGETLAGNIVNITRDLSSVKDQLGSAIQTVKDTKTLIIEILSILYTIDIEIKEGTDQELPKMQHVDDVPKAIGILSTMFSKLGSAIGLFKEGVDGFDKAATGLDSLLSLKDKMKAFGEFAVDEDNAFANFKDAFMSLGAIARLFNDTTIFKPGEEPKEIDFTNVTTLLKKMFEDDEFKNAIEMFNKESIPQVSGEGLKSAEGLIILAGSLSSIAKACMELTGTEDEDINRFIGIIERITFSSGTDSENVSKFSLNIGELGNALSSFASNTMTLDEKNIKLAIQALHAITEIGISLRNLPSDSFLTKIFDGDKGLSAFASNIQSLGTGLGQFLDAINNVNEESENKLSHTYNEANVRMALMTATMITKMAISLDKYDPSKFNTEFFNKFSEFATQLAIALNNLTNPEVLVKPKDDDFGWLLNLFDVASSFLNVMKKAIDLPQPPDDGTIGSFGVWFSRFSALMSGFALEITGEKDKPVANISDSMFYVSESYNAFKDVEKYLPTLQKYIDLFTSIVNAVVRMTATLTNSNNGSLMSGYNDSINAIFESLFGYKEKVTLKGSNVATGASTFEGSLHTLFIFIKDVVADLKANDITKEEFEAAIPYIEGMVKVIQSFANIINSLSHALSETYNSFTNNGANPFGGIGSVYTIPIDAYINTISDIMESIITKESTFTNFFNFTEKFGQRQLDSAHQFLNIISVAGDIMAQSNIFADATFGSSTFDNLSKFDWHGFFESLNYSEFSSEASSFLSPTITPVLNLDDSTFKSQVQQMHAILNGTAVLDKTQELKDALNAGTNYSFTLATESIESIKPIDYSAKLDLLYQRLLSVDSSVGNVGDAVRALNLHVDGEDLVLGIGPAMDKYLGEQGYYAYRINMKN